MHLSIDVTDMHTCYMCTYILNIFSLVYIHIHIHVHTHLCLNICTCTYKQTGRYIHMYMYSFEPSVSRLLFMLLFDASCAFEQLTFAKDTVSAAFKTQEVASGRGVRSSVVSLAKLAKLELEFG